MNVWAEVKQGLDILLYFDSQPISLSYSSFYTVFLHSKPGSFQDHRMDMEEETGQRNT